MDDERKEQSYPIIPVPESVSIAKLHRHFKVQYGVDDGEADTLVVSSSKSLIDFLTAAEFMLKKGKQNISSAELQALLHKGKGLFLIIGQKEWALYVTSLNVSDPDTCYDSIQKAINHVRQGFSDIMNLLQK